MLFNLESIRESLCLRTLWHVKRRFQFQFHSIDLFRDALTALRGDLAQSKIQASNLSVLLPGIAQPVCLALTIPVITCTAERSFPTT